MISNDVSAGYQKLLGSVFDRVYQEQPITPHPSITRAASDCVTLQLRTWSLPYKKALYMDSDMIALTDPDPNFDVYDELSAKEDSVPDPKDKTKRILRYGWNGGMFMTEPKQTTFDGLVDSVHTYNPHSSRTGIQ